MVMTDHCTNFAWGKTVKDKVQDNLLSWGESLCLEYGCPKVVLSDNGGEVTNTLTKSIYNLRIKEKYIYILFRIVESFWSGR